MKSSRLLLAPLLYLFSSLSLFAQNPALDVAKILKDPEANLNEPAGRARAVARIHEIEVRQLQRAQQVARQQGVPLRQKGPDGKIKEVAGLDENGELVFIITHNAAAAISTAADQINLSPYSLDGAGITVGVWDGGSALKTHQEFNEGATSRINIMDGSSPDSHATHVAGTIAASGVVGSAKGMAPAATVDSYYWNSDESEITSRAATGPGQFGTNIYISNHSYGFSYGWSDNTWSGGVTGTDQNAFDPDFGRYSSKARNLDAIAANAPYYLAFYSAGNEGADNPATGAAVTIGGSAVTYDPAIHPPGDRFYSNGFQMIGDHGIAKNVMTIGAAQDAVSAGVRNTSVGTLASFSSTGPTDDGRIKPDVVANGWALYSSYTPDNNTYSNSFGTSMSSPNACGSAALLVEYYRELFADSVMRASTLKGLLIHSATDVGNAGPDYKYGWGYLDVKTAADLLSDHAANPNKQRLVEDQVSTSITSRTYGHYWDGVSPIRVTLSWTDPAAAAEFTHDERTPDLVNDLNVKIVAPDGTEYFPFVMPFVGTWTVASMSELATTGINHVDNVEQILVDAPGQTGQWDIVVSYTGNLTNSVQDYGILVSGTSGTNAPPMFASDPLLAPDATENLAYMGETIANSATDPESDPITYSKVSGPDWLNVAPDGALSGTPGDLDVGINRFVVKATDGLGFDTASLDLTVLNVDDDAPIAYDQSAVIFAGSTVDITLTAIDPESSGLSYSMMSQPSNGTLSGTPPYLTYTPNSLYQGSDSFTFKVNDGGQDSNTATVNISVIAVVEPYFEWDAANDTAGDGTWDSTTANPYSWTFDAGNQSPITVSGSALRAVTKAYLFPAAIDEANVSWDAYASTSSATFEFVVDVDTNNGVIFESGGSGDGIRVDLSGGMLRATIAEATDVVASHQLTDQEKADYIHVTVVADNLFNKLKLYINGELVNSQNWSAGDDWSGGDGAGLGGTNSATPDNGDSGNFSGSMALFRFYRNLAMAEQTILAKYQTLDPGEPNNAPVWNSNPVVEANAVYDNAYSSSLSNDVSDPENDTLVFTKQSGPAWLNIASDGSLSGTPSSSDIGSNTFTVSVFDGLNTPEATLNIEVTAPALALTIASASIAEAGGMAATTATVSRNSATDGDLQVSLDSSDTSEATTPASVTIPAGQSAATFDIDTYDDQFVDGTQTVTITATATAHTTASDTLNVTDSNLPALAVVIDSALMSENGGSSMATVSRNSIPSGDLTVNLSSDDISEALTPSTVTILDGNASATFNVSAANDADLDGTQTVTITASTPSGSATVASTDFTNRIVSAATASNITWTLDGASDPGDLTTTGSVLLLDNAAAQGRFVPTQTMKNSGSWTSTVPLNLTSPGLQLTEVVIDYQHFEANGANGLQTSNCSVDWTVTLTGSSSGQIGTQTVTSASATSGVDTLTFASPLDLTNSETYTLAITATGVATPSQGTFTGLNSVSINGATSGSHASGSDTIDVTDDDAPSVNITYAGNGSTAGTAPADGTTYNNGDTVTVLGPGDLTRIGHSFASWNTAADGTGATHTPSSTFNLFTNTTLYAQWTVETFIVSYDGNGNTGGTAPGSQTKTYDVNLSLASQGSLSRSSHSFSGWNTSASGSGDAYAAGATYSANAPTTLHAQWDTNNLALTINGASISENGASTSATVSRETSTESELIVSLSSDDTSEATVPATVTIPVGQASATFEITGIDDSIVDGTQTVTITASGENQFSGSDTLEVTDDDTPALTVTISAASIAEEAGSAATTATLSRNTDTTGELIVSLASDDSSEANVPASVTIAAGQSSATFEITAVEDDELDGTQIATITASTAGHSDGLDTLEITDNESLVTYDGNGNDGGSPPADQTKIYNTDLILSDMGTLTRTGYDFGGWNTAADGTGIGYAPGAAYGDNAQITFYAQWDSGPAAIYEPFTQNAGPLGGQAAGFGLSGNWSVDQTVNVASPATLAYGDLPETGGQAELPDGTGVDAWVAINSNLNDNNLLADNAILWFSLVYQKTSGSSSNEHSGFALGTERVDGAYNGARMNTGYGVGFYTNANTISAATWNNGGQTTGGSFTVPYSTPMLIVGKIEWGATAGDPETITLYKPSLTALETPGTGVSHTITGFDQSLLDTLSFTQRNSGGTQTYDEIRFGSTYESVTGGGANAGPVDHFVISPISETATVGTPITGITITAQDSANNTATGFTGTVTLGGTGGFSATSANFTAGVLSGVSATPTVAGTNLTLTVDDGSGHTGSTTIATIQSIYGGWSGGSAESIDDNSDGISNGIAWVLDAADPAANANALLPDMDRISDVNYLIYNYRRSDDANEDPSTAISVEFSSDLINWSTATHDGSNVIIIENNDGYGPGVDHVEVKINRSLAPEGTLFMRLNVIMNP